MKLSIITTGRNDNYCGNFVQRISWQIKRHCLNIESLNLQNEVEIIVVDWGSPSDEKLSDVIDISKPYLKWVYVPTEVTRSISSGFSNSHAWNVGARKSSGHFLLHTEGDSYITLDAFTKLVNYLEDNKGNNLYSWGSRYQMPYEFHSKCETLEDIEYEIDEWLNGNKIWVNKLFNDINLAIAKVHSRCINESGQFQGGGTVQLTSRSVYFDCTGVSEIFTKWGYMDIDFHIRVTSKYPWLGDLEEIINSKIYAFNHHEISYGGNIHGVNNSINQDYKANSDDWGLINYDIKVYN